MFFFPHNKSKNEQNLVLSEREEIDVFKIKRWKQSICCFMLEEMEVEYMLCVKVKKEAKLLI